ncbi:MAG: hypothetical protein AB8C40_07235 [Gammaproteobacteria bacterium]
MGNQTKPVAKKLFSLISCLQCAKCGCEQLTENATSIDCNQCKQSYPKLEFGDITIPFVFSDVNAALQSWCARINGFEQKIKEDIESLERQLKNKTISKISKEKLKSLLRCKKQYRDQIKDHLGCFEQYNREQHVYSSNEIAKNQGIDSYINNIFRDWCWNNGENEELLDSINGVVDDDYQAGHTLTLGAGASRFSYDFHAQYNAQHSVLLDINPVLLGSAAKIINNETITLNEFPIAPLTIEDFAIEQQCQINSQYKHDFSFLLSDALDVPMIDKTFDTVLTPWVIDIIPIDFKSFIPRVNCLLKTGGMWINTGSLAFFHSDPVWNYSQEEIVDLLKKHGFANIQIKRTEINYLNSPHSAHGRIENVFSFSAKKKFDSIAVEKFNYLPDWINNHSISIPNQAELMAASSKHLLQAQVLSAIDGERSIEAIADLLAKQYDMAVDDAIAAVRQILIDNL